MTPHDAEQRLIERARIERLILTRLEALRVEQANDNNATRRWDREAAMRELIGLMALIDEGSHNDRGRPQLHLVEEDRS